MAKIVVRKDESIDAALRRFNQQVQDDQILAELKRRRFHEKPSAERKRKQAEKIRKSRKETRVNEERD